MALSTQSLLLLLLSYPPGLWQVIVEPMDCQSAGHCVDLIAGATSTTYVVGARAREGWNRPVDSLDGTVRPAACILESILAGAALTMVEVRQVWVILPAGTVPATLRVTQDRWESGAQVVASSRHLADRFYLSISGADGKLWIGESGPDASVALHVLRRQFEDATSGTIEELNCASRLLRRVRRSSDR